MHLSARHIPGLAEAQGELALVALNLMDLQVEPAPLQQQLRATSIDSPAPRPVNLKDKDIVRVPVWAKALQTEAVR